MMQLIHLMVNTVWPDWQIWGNFGHSEPLCICLRYISLQMACVHGRHDWTGLYGGRQLYSTHKQ